MSSFLYLLIFTLQLLCLCCRSQSVTAPQCDEADMSALLQFKNSFVVDRGFASTDPLAYPKTESWELGNAKNGSSPNCCSWDGVECDDYSGRVIALDLSSSYLYGSINSSSSLFRLAHLQRLSLADNHFNYSEIPSGIGLLSGCNRNPEFCSGLLNLHSSGLTNLVQNLTNLQQLTLDNVDLSSKVPASIVNLSSLTSLSLASSNLFGIFPSGVFQLPKLEYISLAFNGNLTGHLPEFNSTSPLQVLQLNRTGFSGVLPDSLGNLRFLKFLDIESSNFSGSFPASFSNLTELTYLSVRANPFAPQSLDSLTWLGKLSKLETLYLAKNNLQGKIPSSIGNLSRLVTVGLAGNDLKGEIPPELVNLPRLGKLNLWANQLSGRIEHCLTNMTQISFLGLSSNYFNGPIPSSVSRLQNLQFLYLFGNQLSGAVELDAFLQIKNLQILQSSWNNLSCVPETKGNATLPQLLLLGLGSCNLTEFPSFLKDQMQLSRLDLSNNHISGKVTEWFSNMCLNSLQFLNLSHNALTGFDWEMAALPWNRLDTLDLSSNSLQGSVPVPPPSTRFYLVSNNELTGFPESVCNSSSLVALDLSSNFMTGMLPSCLGNISNNLSVLNLKSNRFHGTIPEIRISGTQLKMIDLCQNEFEGKLPRSLANYPTLEFIDIGNNRLADTFPFWLETLPQLQVLILRSNRFFGAVGKPSSNSSFPRLRIIDLSGNSFTGDLPREYFQSWKSMQTVDNSTGDASYLKQCVSKRCLPPDTFLYTSYSQYDFSVLLINKGIETYYPKIPDIFTVMDLSSNMFEGSIPDGIGNLKALHLLNLSNNFLTGHIPSSLGNLGELESLDLSRNRLSGQIPQELSSLNFLSAFNVSHNNLSWPIPEGKQFGTFLESSFEGNDGLCGDALSKKCEASGTEPAAPEGDEDSWILFDWKTVLIGWGSGLMIGMAIGYAFISEDRRWFAEIVTRVKEQVYKGHHTEELNLIEGEITEEQRHELDPTEDDSYSLIKRKEFKT